jgi:cell division protein FtsQ
VTNQGNTTNRPLLWDDDPPPELRRARKREDSPAEARVRRSAPGMPLRFDDADDDGVLRPAANRSVDRFGAPGAPARSNWARPASTAGRVFLSIGALVVLGGVAVSGVLIARYLEHDARFRMAGSGNIEASGLNEVSRGDLLPVFGEDIGRNVFFVPLAERRRQLEGIPWIEHATVMRVLPDQIRVAVVERQPVAFTQHGQQIGLVDANGVLLAMAAKTMAERHYSFPVVTGIDPGDSAESRKARMAVYLRLIAELDADGKHNSEQISEIDLTDPEDARVLMPEQGTDILAHFGDDRFLERFERYKAHIAEWRQQYPHLKSVDLRYDNQVVLDMASGAETSDSSAGTDATANSSAPAAGPAAGTAPDTSAQSGAPAKPSAKKNMPAQDKKHTTPKRTAFDTGRRNSAAMPSRGLTGGE